MRMILTLMTGMLLAAGTLMAQAPDAGKKVDSVGYGATVDEAKKDALKNAVEEVLGVSVSDASLVKNAEVIYNKVLRKADGFCVPEKWGEPQKGADGLVLITCTVAVKEKEIKNALGDVLTGLANPTVLVIPDNNPYLQELTVEDKLLLKGIGSGIKQALIAKGFDVVMSDPSQIGKNLMTDADLLEKKVSKSAMLQHALTHRADYVVSYGKVIKTVKPSGIDPKKINAVVKTNAQIYNAVTSDLIVDVDAQGEGSDNNAIQENAVDVAMRDAGNKFVGAEGDQKALDRITTNFKGQLKNGISYVVTFQGGNTFQMSRKLNKIFEALPDYIIAKDDVKKDGVDVIYTFRSHQTDVSEIGMEILEHLIKDNNLTVPKDYMGIVEQRGQKIVIDLKPLTAGEAPGK